MRILTGPDGPATDLVRLRTSRRLYAAPDGPWLRANMVSTVDGAATGESGKSGSINNAVDKRIFDLLRELADAVVVGAGTARVEGYRPADRPTVVVSRSGRVPERLRDAEPGRVLMATCRAAHALDEARAVLGDDNVLVLGGHRVDLAALKARLAERGLTPPALRGRPAPAARPARPGRPGRAGRDAGARGWSAGCTRGSPTARPSTYPSSCGCCSRRSTPCSGAGSYVVTIEPSCLNCGV